MSEPILMKDKLSEQAVIQISDVLSQIITDFPRKQFIADACDGLEKLELKQRVTHIIHVLSQYLPQDFNQTAALLLAVKHYWSEKSDGAGWNAFTAWPLIDYVAVYGLETPDKALDVFEILTSLFTAEFAIRPFITHHFELTHDRMMIWTQHSNEHVRRLASEGCRTRLPWASQLAELRNDPTSNFEILEKLKDDSSLYVRKSVANNLNDITKDYPDKVLELCRSWSKDATSERLWIIKHALRTLIKSGHTEAFEILGFSRDPKIKIEHFKLSQSDVALGQEMTMSLTLVSAASEHQNLIVDFNIYYVKSNGRQTKKTFKWKTVCLEAKQTLEITKMLMFKTLSTRRYYSGEHIIELMVNGQVLSETRFILNTD